MYISNTRSRGFTFIETMLVAVMVSVITLAIYSTFKSGMNVWQRLTSAGEAKEPNILLEKLAQDLRNSFAFSQIQFLGSLDKLSFASLVMTQTEKEDQALTIGRIGYSFDAYSETINRWQADYSQIYQNKTGALREILNNVKALKFQYYYFDPKSEECIWQDVWGESEKQQDKIPQAIRVKIYFNQDAKNQEITRTIAIPAGG